MDLLKAILAIILPPASVWLHTREFGTPFWINCILTLLGHIPGVVHAIYLLACTPAAVVVAPAAA